MLGKIASFDALANGLIDFSDSPKSNIEYGGSEVKEGIIYRGNAYMLKFPKLLDRGVKSNNCFSEYVGSHLMKAFGIDTHDTLLGNYGNHIVVACKNFVSGTEFDLK